MRGNPANWMNTVSSPYLRDNKIVSGSNYDASAYKSVQDNGIYGSAQKAQTDMNKPVTGTPFSSVGRGGAIGVPLGRSTVDSQQLYRNSKPDVATQFGIAGSKQWADWVKKKN